MNTIPLDEPALEYLNRLLPDSDQEDGDVLDSLPPLATVARWARFNVRAVMMEAIEQGATYQEVADAVGISRQSAWEALNPRNGTPLSVSLDQLRLF